MNSSLGLLENARKRPQKQADWPKMMPFGVAADWWWWRLRHFWFSPLEISTAVGLDASLLRRFIFDFRISRKSWKCHFTILGVCISGLKLLEENCLQIKLSFFVQVRNLEGKILLNLSRKLMNRGKNIAILTHEWIISETRIEVHYLLERSGEIDENWSNRTKLELGLKWNGFWLSFH